MRDIYIDRKELPDSVKEALDSIGIHQKDFGLIVTETETMFANSGDGSKGFACMVNLETGARSIRCGSWGGENMFNPGNMVDRDDTEKPLPPGFILIKGHIGGSNYAMLYVAPGTMNRLALPAPDNWVTVPQANVLGAIVNLRSSPERKETIRKAGASAAEVDELVSKGLLTRNKAGAMAVTAKGRNAYEAAKKRFNVGYSRGGPILTNF